MKPLLALFAALVIIATGGFVGGQLVPSPAPRPAPGPKPITPSPIAQAAKIYAQDLARAKADAWRASALAIRGGATVQDAQTTGEGAFKAAREADFAKVITPHLSAVVPEGADLTTADQRNQLAAVLEQLADAVDPKPAEPARTPPDPADPHEGPTGWVDAPARLELLKQLPNRTFSRAAPELVQFNDPKADVFLYKAWQDVLGAFPDYPSQQIGDCTSFGSGHAIDLLQCVDIAIRGGDKKEYRETSTEVIYGLGREIAGMLGRGDGCYGAAVSKALTDVGALSRETVGAYSGQRAKQYGQAGVPTNFKALAADHKLGSATLVTTLDEADAALRNGYPFIVCSNQGFTMTRNADGLCEARGRWPHCMFVAGVRTRTGERQYLVCQSWGSQTPSGPVADDQPPFSFWIRGRVMAHMLAAQDSLAFSSFAGFTRRAIPAHWFYSGFAKPPAASKPSTPPLRKAA